MVKYQLKTPVQYLKGVGPKLAKLFAKLNIFVIEDLLYFFPREYEDRRKVTPIRHLKPQDQVIIKGEIIKITSRQTRPRFSIMILTVADSLGRIEAVFFNQPFLQRTFRAGMKVILSGRVEVNLYKGGMQFNVKDWEIDTGLPLAIIPVYPLTEGLYPKSLRKITQRALDECLPQLKDYLPADLRSKHELMDIKNAIETLHYPEDLKYVEAARYRIVFDDLFVFQLGWGLRRANVKKEKGISFKIDRSKVSAFIENLPFELTEAQKRVIREIEADLENGYPMSRLLQGDVGSGKTIVSALATYIVILNGYQVALMAPTEILAQQHCEKMRQYLKDFGIKVELITGTTQRKKKTYDLSKWDLIVGTHALIEEKVKFEKLGLAIIDEQHRFGVLQRSALSKKGIFPDMLFMTATPIPRSLALTLYGDLDRSVIDEMPKGRKPIKTHYVPEKRRRDAYGFMREQVKKGNQIFMVYPLVEESEEVDLKAAKEEALKLQEEVFPDLKVGLIHGRMKGAEKDEIMQAFRDKKIDILVSTTVIEVGIDIPNASVMVIEHAERFGLSQLHQLRGRIGRGSSESYCFLIGEPKTQEAKIRIKTMLESNDGFKIAEVDLRLRGPGDFYGARQSGLPEFRAADIIRDEKVLRLARQAAFNLIKGDPILDDHPELKQQIYGRYGSFLGY